MIRTAPSLAAALIAANVTFASAALTTVFGPNGTVGASVPDAAVLNDLADFTNFGVPNSATEAFANSPNLGETLFFAFGPLYVGGAGPASSNPLSAQGEINLGAPVSNNRGYGVIGEGRSDITFDSGVVDSVLLQVRGTELGQTTGGNPATNFGGVPTDLDDAVASVIIWTEFGAEAFLQVTNDDFQILQVDSADLLGDSISRISLINEGPDNSAVILGELTVGLVPEPASLSLLLIATLAATRRR